MINEKKEDLKNNKYIRFSFSDDGMKMYFIFDKKNKKINFNDSVMEFAIFNNVNIINVVKKINYIKKKDEVKEIINWYIKEELENKNSERFNYILKEYEKLGFESFSEKYNLKDQYIHKEKSKDIKYYIYFNEEMEIEELYEKNGIKIEIKKED